jgi:hypothetical protein
MWPYNDDEAGWLKPRDGAETAPHGSANDNDPARQVARRRTPIPPRDTPKS